MTTKHEHNFARYGRDIVIASDRGQEQPKLQPGVYLVKFDPNRGFFLTEQEPLSMPSKTYGATDGRADKILNTFLSRPGLNTGVLLTGNKGSGKTLLSRQVCVKGHDIGLPTLIISDPFIGSSFIEFINNIVQPCIIHIDEFEKIYRETKEQNCLLSLLDGTGTNNKLYLLTSNSEKISEFMLSRPSRLFYHWRYGKLDEGVLIGYCEDNLKDQKHTKNIRTLWGLSSDMSFDILQAIVEELNRYPEADFVSNLSDMNVSLGDALCRIYACTSVMLGNEELKLYGNNAMNLNVITMQDGTTLINTSVKIEDLKTQIALSQELGFKGCYFYNRSLAEMVEKGETTLEDASDSNFDEEFQFRMKFSPSEGDRLDAEGFTMTRKVLGQDLVVRYETPKTDRAENYFRKLFD